MTRIGPATEPLINSYRAVICDLDGVVYRGAVAIDGAIPTLDKIVGDGVPVVFATNNASRPPEDVAAHLRELGLGEHGWSVATSSQAAAAFLAERLAPDTPICAVGGPGVPLALREAGLTPLRVSELDGQPVSAVVQGLGEDVTWAELAEIAYLVQGGATWVATNLDLMLPKTRGPAPGNGAMVAAVRAATAVEPEVVVGKPGPALYELARERLGTDRASTLACGDRLDTDIEGANAAGVDSLFVLSGAHRLRDLAFAEHHARPAFVATDVTGLVRPGLRVTPSESGLVALGADGIPHFRSEVDSAELLRGLVNAVWHARDAGRHVSDEDEVWQELERTLGIG